MVGGRKAPKVGAQGFGLHATSAEDVPRTAFLRRNLLDCPVVKAPRENDNVLICNREFLGTWELSKVQEAETMSAEALGLQFMFAEGADKSESWWVASHGR